ncbi:GspE/PulE family protein [Dickeya fangzhongdai]|uniref:GspE/PulE family protein n=1 Tax=Dickeya fangzhongdai TaxID=1778540 RepID=UPI002B258C12|nr:ATPase, T2SS/T4P/T4SS family [Dickeya fangzhongdai]WOY03081.1 ATPase, T2SS/T4P/T4SS family [Dickeya fangzhongdai]
MPAMQQVDKDILDFVLVETPRVGATKLVIDINRRGDERIQRWVMDQRKRSPRAETEFVPLSELISRRLQLTIPSTDATGDLSESQKKVVAYLTLAEQHAASDIHFTISHDRNLTIIEMRVHGELYVIDELTAEEGRTLVSTIYLSMCDLHETSFYDNKIQSGRIDALYARRAGLYGARYEHKPTADGLYVVLRTILDDGDQVPTLADQGFLPEQEKECRYILRQPEGMVVLSGPTGSGKSTTLRVFSRMWLDQYQGRRRLLTQEYPIEGRTAGAVQTPVIPKSQSPDDVAQAWKDGDASLLRLDPDGIVNGEMREFYSLMSGIYASQTGHLLMSTLHSNSAVGILSRMAVMGVDRHLIADAQLMIGLISQRLVPVLCPHCRVPWHEKAPTLSEETRARLEQWCNEPGICTPEQLWFRHPDGCPRCQKMLELTGRIVSRGVIGRTAIAEVIRPDARFMSLWLSHGNAVARQYWRNNLGGISRLQHLLRRLAEGRVDPLEGDRVCPLDEDAVLASEVPHV